MEVAGSARSGRTGKPLRRKQAFVRVGVCLPLAQMNEEKIMKPVTAIYQIFKMMFGALLLVVCLSGLTMAQSVLSDDAHTSTLPKDLDTNFGTSPNLTVSATN